MLDDALPGIALLALSIKFVLHYCEKEAGRKGPLLSLDFHQDASWSVALRSNILGFRYVDSKLV